MNVSREDVIKKYTQYENSDPFPKKVGLLNSADIQDYVDALGLIYPFDKSNLKPASYGVKLKGEYMYWNTREDRQYGMLEDIKDADSSGHKIFRLKKNSIAFVQLEPEFRFPIYIAARFNLRIKHIYQGLLLGTGPLVDPGFEGHIYIPLHNLTNNDYDIRIDEPLIWMEFTKLNDHHKWSKNATSHNDIVVLDKERMKQRRSLPDYINEAYPNAPIVSTIPDILFETQKNILKFDERIAQGEESIRAASDGVNRATNSFNRAVLISIIAVCTTLAVTIFQNLSVHYKTMDYVKDNDKKQQEFYSKYAINEHEIFALEKELFELTKKSQKQQDEIDSLKKGIIHKHNP